MNNVLIQIGTGLVLLVVEYFVIQKMLGERDKPPTIQQSATGAVGTTTQTTNVRRTLVVTKVANVTHVHPPAAPSASSGASSTDTTWGFLIAAAIAVVALAAILAAYGLLIRDVLGGITLGLALLAIVLAWRGRGTEVPVLRWTAETLGTSTAIGVSSTRLLTQTYAGVSWGDLSSSTRGLHFFEWSNLLSTYGIEVLGSFALQAIGAGLLAAAAALVIWRITGVFAAVGALSRIGEVSSTQAGIVLRCYDASKSGIVLVAVATLVGTALAGGWVSHWFLRLAG